MKLNKQFFLGAILAIVLMVGTAAVTRQMIGPAYATTDTALVRWNGTTAFKTLNSGVLLGTDDDMTGIKSLAFGQSKPAVVDLGTVGNGSTATLLATNSNYKVTFSGVGAIIALPGSPSDGVWTLHGTTTYSSGVQIVTVPSLIRPELNFETAVTTFTNSQPTTSGLFTVQFTAIGGAFIKFSVIGDAYSP